VIRKFWSASLHVTRTRSLAAGKAGQHVLALQTLDETIAERNHLEFDVRDLRVIDEGLHPACVPLPSSPQARTMP